MLALVVHAGFFALLIFGITWQAKEPAGVVVDLWADLPAAKPVVQAPVVKPPVNKPEPPPPEPEPVKKAVPKPIPPTPTKTPDIALKEKRIQETKRKQDLAQQEQLRQEQIKQEQTRLTEMARQQQAQAELTRRAQAQQAAAQQAIKDDYTGRIQSKIQSKLNKSLCGDGKPQLEFDIALLPTGQLRGNPILRKGSGIAACDKAVENAILQSEPLPVPQSDAFNLFRELHLKFKPNE